MAICMPCKAQGSSSLNKPTCIEGGYLRASQAMHGLMHAHDLMPSQPDENQQLPLKLLPHFLASQECLHSAHQSHSHALSSVQGEDEPCSNQNMCMIWNKPDLGDEHMFPVRIDIMKRRNGTCSTRTLVPSLEVPPGHPTQS